MKLTKQLVQKLMKIEGEARGIHFKNDAEYVLETKGEEGLKKVEDELKKLGTPIDYENIETMGFYPMGLRAISLLVIQETFNWGNEEIKKLCGFASRISLIIKFYMKFFYSVSKMAEKAPKIWKDYFTKGELIIKDYDEKKGYAIFQIKDFKLHSVFCRCFEGFVEHIIRMLVRAKSVECQETKCIFKGDKHHEYLVKWQ